MKSHSPELQNNHRNRNIVLLLLIVGGALGLRLYAASVMSEAHDEDDYLSAARHYRELMIEGEWGAIIDMQQNSEHPPLGKLLFAAVLDKNELEAIPVEVKRGSRNPLPSNSLRNTRLQAVAAGTLTVLVTALSNPIGGAMLAVQSIHFRFSALAYLDALPTLFMALAAFLYAQSLCNDKRHILLFYLAAASFGLSVACKYPYAIAGFALICHALFYRHYSLKMIFQWGILAIAVFFIFNPYLWHDPLNRLWEQMTYHNEYAGNQIESRSFMTPFRQLATPYSHLPEELHPRMWMVSEWITFLSLFPGVPVLLRQKSVYAWWFVFGMVFSILWPTQWIQHNMLIIVPYSLCAGAGLQWGWMQVRKTTYHFVPRRNPTG
ncbi:MAG TPA: hypothetical protein VJZ27_03855 [Aggregatilineales bacterium]|nr:hypothetical protein [Aggregatilineales bacterium]